MTPLSITIKSPEKIGKKMLIEIDADKFERLAANLGFFNPDFLTSLDRAGKDVRAGKIYKLKSLKGLKK
ncbi:MAG: hypothetical protein A3A08_00735 [Candidatus Nealsonbacteria bacterium RIFCSPLOWO2_01_FULL_41_9]|uniref:Uncharacterized protein n=1 Tax=Candidatus Nealsonbacteria bacterium RIFCSPLOWO2_01_FULL_41_9 TaxID=1801671 RepID=A0A1G2EC54_9BACT|nr:MAG: hypothetical protein A3A08_00735 [Candidatus Nealsonbacteria bacterium RIFCSPLOWO2_01_FULL_41_9]